MQMWAIALLSPALLLGQLTSNSITVTASQPAIVQPDEAVYQVVVNSGLAESLDDVVNALSRVGLTAANLAGVGTPAPSTSTTQTQPVLAWTFQLTVPFSKQHSVMSSLAWLQANIGQNNTGLSLTYSMAGTASSGQQASPCNLAALIASARAQAQSLAAAAGVGMGGIAGITGSVSNSVPACTLSVRFALGSGPGSATPNAITINASRTTAATPDQVSVYIYIVTGSTAAFSDVSGALTAAGIAGASFSGVATTYVQLSSQSQTGLLWTFVLTTPFSSLPATLGQLITAQQTIAKQNSVLSMAFTTGGASSSVTPACPDAGLVSDAQTAAQNLAAAAGASLGQILSMSGGNAGIISNPILGATGGFIALQGTVSSAITAAPFLISGTQSVCAATIQFQQL